MANTKSINPEQAPDTTPDLSPDLNPDQAREQLLAGIPVTERRLDLAGISTTVLEGGTGPAVVLLHGPAACAVHWRGVIPDLTDNHHVVVPDLPGHGESRVEGGPLDAERVVTWLAELVEATCEGPPALVGQALGGAIAATFAGTHPALLSRLVLIDTLGLSAFAPAPEFGQALEAFLTEPGRQTHDQLWRRCAFDLDGLRDRMRGTWEAFATYNVDRARTPSVQSALHTLMGTFGFAAIDPEVLDRIAVPTTLVWGRHDIAIPLPVAEDASGRYGWPLRVIEGAADDPPVEQPEALVAVLRAVLGTTTVGTGGQ
ncbi:MAG: alpha/beta fold hydrolase [Ilumatobacteraceae bacterium]